MERKLIDLCKSLIGNRDMIRKSYLDGEYEIDVQVKRVKEDDFDDFIFWIDDLPDDLRDKAIMMAINNEVYSLDDLRRKKAIHNIYKFIDNLKDE